MQQKKCAAYRAVWAGLVGLSILAPLSGCTKSKGERISAIYELKADPTPQNVDRLRRLAADPDRDIRATALNALVSVRSDGAAELARKALGDEDGFVRATAAKLLADLGDPADAGILASRLREDPDPVVRRRAAEALTRLGGDPANETAVAALADGLRDPIEDVRLAAAQGIRELDPGYAVAELARLLLEDPNHDVRVQAAGALGESGDPEAQPVLEAALADPNEFVRAAAANALRVHRTVVPKVRAPEAAPPGEAGTAPQQATSPPASPPAPADGGASTPETGGR